MKQEIEAATHFLTTLLFPPTPQTLINHPLSQSTPSLRPPTPLATSFPISTSSNNITVHTIATVEDNEKKAKAFSKSLSKILAKKFVNHWYEDEAIKGQAYRSILVDCENNFIDKVIVTSARKANVKNLEGKLKSAAKNGFQMWIDPGEVEVEFFAVSNANSSPYKSSPTKSNHTLLYSTRRPIPPSSLPLPLPSSPPPSSPSFLTSSSPPSSPAHSSYFPFSADTPKKAIFTRQSKPIRISNRQHGEDAFDDQKLDDHLKDENINSDEHPPHHSLHLLPPGGDFAVLQPAM